MILGVLGMLAVIHHDGTSVGALDLFIPELLAGIGMGALLAPLFDFVLAGVDDDEVGSASGVLNAMQQLGGAIGIAVVGTLFFSLVSSRGFVIAIERMLLLEVGILLVAAALVFLLPKHARESEH